VSRPTRATGTVTLADLRTAGASLFGGTAETRGDAEIVDVTHDSRQAGPGVLFACRPGLSADGHDFAPQALAAGAAALLTERWLELDVPQLRVPSVAQAMGPISARVHGDPSHALLLVGITGTNGKTTSAYLTEAALAGAGYETGLIGTIETRIRGTALEGVRTTPESTDLQRLLRRMVDEGVTGASMEVSSHGLALGRVSGTRFAATVFTNLTQDHLDFHGDLERYFAAKASLFTPEYTAVGVINVDDRYGRRLADEAPVETVRVSPSGSRDADVSAGGVKTGPAGTSFTAHLRGGSIPVDVALVGDFSVANALGVLAAAERLGVDPRAAAAGIANLPGVPGRMERVEGGQDFTVLVDYAHTPDSVARVLEACRGLASGRVIVVLGCGGDRDRGKRPMMGAAAAAGADIAVFTSDNPRSEDPEAILAAMAGGAAETGGRHESEPDRRAAIGRAIELATAGDVVLIAGKGHERTQEVRGVHHPFDDRAVAHEFLEARA
jgi:UDP-N-acetylmuramoyl-L-alanyl-D-glutamate--2,6-diaminopimelate ligase